MLFFVFQYSNCVMCMEGWRRGKNFISWNGVWAFFYNQNCAVNSSAHKYRQNRLELYRRKKIIIGTSIYFLAGSRKCGFSPLLSEGIDVSPHLWCQMEAGVTPFIPTYNNTYIGIGVKRPAGYLKSNILGHPTNKGCAIFIEQP